MRLSTRCGIRVAVALLAGWWLGAPTFAQPTDFVRRQGRFLIVQGRHFYLSGANAYYLPFKPAVTVDETLRDAAAVGLNALRTWGSCEGTSVFGLCFQPEPGVYDETTFQHLDDVIAKAGQANLRLIIPLVNNWDHTGGMDQYVAWCKPGGNHDEFYTDPCAKDLYRRYVEHVLTRVNTVTGVRYRDDPTIMLWELANEPRAPSDPTGTTLFTWIEEMAAYVKSLDPNHLVGTGEEGWHVTKGGDWRHDGSEGADFLRNSGSSFIDVASFHLYPKSYAMSEAEALAWITEHVTDAHTVVGKPVVLGEFGWYVPRYLFGDFELGTETWRVDWGFSDDSPQRVDEPSANGNGALRYLPAGTLNPREKAAGEHWLPDAGVDLRAHTILTAQVYVPAEAPNDLQADLFTKSGPAWEWINGAEVTLVPGAWSTVTLSTAMIPYPDQVRSVGVRLINGNSAYNDPIYYDVITAFSTTPGETMADRTRVYTDWYARLDARDTDAAMVWMLGSHDEDTTLLPDADSFMVYVPEDADTAAVLQAYSAVVAKKNRAQTTRLLRRP